MHIAIITGSAGLVGSEAVAYFSNKFDKIIGIDNNARELFFGKEGNTNKTADKLKQQYSNYDHKNIDIRNNDELSILFKEFGSDIKLIIHAAAQPSHDWAAKDPHTDFSINANGTLTLLELTRKHCPDAVFIYTSTNKVYGDHPNFIPFIETESRFEVDKNNINYKGINESMNIDSSIHSLFGVSKLSADLLTQEYARYFGIKTGIFRAGCITGGNHAGVELHGFLSYLVRCAITGKTYTIYGYKGKQVRDIIHANDLAKAFEQFYLIPRAGEIYNIGGGRAVNCSILEAIDITNKITHHQLKFVHDNKNRIGDHQWYISDTSKFRSHYPDWKIKFTLDSIIAEIARNV